jgi:flagellin-like protein
MQRPDRAQSEVIGVVLLLGLTITAVGVTVALGSAALGDVQSSADVQRIEGAMTQVDSKASLVAHGGSTSQRVRLDPSRNADVRVDGDAGTMRIEIEAENETGGVETVTKNVTLGAIVYEQGDERVAYQGGVWRSNGDGSWMVSPPEFHYRGDTLTLPLVTIDGADGRLGDAAVVTGRSEHPEGLFPSENVSNPLLGGNVTVTVESEYAQAWGRFFEIRTRGNVTRISSTEVRVALRTETVHPTLSASVSALGTSRLDFGGINTLYADSYDSDDGPYPGKGSANDGAVIQTTSDFQLTSQGGGNTESIEVRGDLVAESFKTPKGQAKKKLKVTGEQRVDDSLELAEPVAGAISERIKEVRDLDLQSAGASTTGFAHDDGSVRVVDEDTYIDGDVTVSDGSTLRIEDGATVQITGELDVSGDGEVEFESGDGDLALLVEGGVSMRDQAALQARGGNRVELFVDGAVAVRNNAAITTASDTRFKLYNTGGVDVTERARIAADDDVAGNLWLYSSGSSVDFQGAPNDGIDFVGVMYAPTSDVLVKDNMTFKGSFTSGCFAFDDADLDLHYDESLATLQPFEGDSVPVVSHLHVSRHRVTVEDD